MRRHMMPVYHPPTRSERGINDYAARGNGWSLVRLAVERAQREERSTRVDGAYGVRFKEYIAKLAAENEITRSQR
jgi:hypothetical protein